MRISPALEQENLIAYFSSFHRLFNWFFSSVAFIVAVSSDASDENQASLKGALERKYDDSRWNFRIFWRKYKWHWDNVHLDKRMSKLFIILICVEHSKGDYTQLYRRIFWRPRFNIRLRGNDCETWFMKKCPVLKITGTMVLSHRYTNHLPADLKRLFPIHNCKHHTVKGGLCNVYL